MTGDNCRRWLARLGVPLAAFVALVLACASPPEAIDSEGGSDLELQLDKASDLINQARVHRARVEASWESGAIATSGAWPISRDYSYASHLYADSLEIRERTLGSNDPTLAQTLIELASLHIYWGDGARATPILERLLPILRGSAGADDSQLFATLVYLGDIRVYDGDLRTAASLYEEALRAVGEDPSVNVVGYDPLPGSRPLPIPSILQILNRLARLYLALGDYQRAEDLTNRAAAFALKTLGLRLAAGAALGTDVARRISEGTPPNLIELLDALNLLARVDLARGAYDRATALLEVSSSFFLATSQAKMMAGWSQQLKSNRHRLASNVYFLQSGDALIHLSMAYEGKGELERAQDAAERAFKRVPFDLRFRSHRLQADALERLAHIQMRRGNLRDARRLQKRALEIRKKTTRGHDPSLPRSIVALAELCEAERDLKCAASLYERAEELDEKALTLLLPTLAEEQARGYMSSVSTTTDSVLSLRRRIPTEAMTRLALTTVLRRKGRILDALSTSMESLRKALTPEDREILDRLREKRECLARLVLFGPGEDEESYEAMVDRVTEELASVEREAHRRGGFLRNAAAPVMIDEIQPLLAGDAALVEWAVYSDRDAMTGTRGSRRYVAFVLRSEVQPQALELGDAAAIDEQVWALRGAVARPTSAGFRGIARKLDVAVFEPLEALLDGVRHVLAAPDGGLQLIDLGVLIDKNGGHRIERTLFTYMTSGRDLLRYEGMSPSREVAWVVGGPDFERSDDVSVPVVPEPLSRILAAGDLEEWTFAPLPGATAEAQAIGRILPEARVLTGSAASESRIKGLEGPELLHLATHGFFLEDEQGSLSESARGLGWVRSEIGPTVLSRIPGGNPLLRSGLALAGANRRAGGADDGVLTALEASGLDLHGTKLVVLSACDSGLGDVHVGEGIYGLRRAFTLAGAASLVMSLWKIDDVATAALMTSYYEKLQAGLGRSQALRETQLELLRSENRHHPYFWGGFVSLGDWRPLWER